MPRGNRTGPMGMGAMTGRAAGFCAGFGMPGYMNTLPGRGFGLGFGRGRGVWGRRFGGGGRGRLNIGLPGRMWFGGYAAPYGYPEPYAEPDQEREKQMLKNQAEALQSEMDYIKKRLDEIESAG